MLVDFVPLLVDNYVGRNGIKIVLLAQLGALGIADTSVNAMNVGYHLVPLVDRRGGIGNVYVNYVFHFFFDRLDGFHGSTAWHAPCVPEIDEDGLALVGSDEGFDNLSGGHLLGYVDDGECALGGSFFPQLLRGFGIGFRFLSDLFILGL